MAAIDRPRPHFLAPSPYARLGLAPGASATEIRMAQRALVKRFHPDRAGDASTPEFLAIQAAYETLLARPAIAVRAPRRAEPPAWTGAGRPVRHAGPGPISANAHEWRARETAWAGGRWYWEGLGANAAKRARRERTG